MILRLLIAGFVLFYPAVLVPAEEAVTLDGAFVQGGMVRGQTAPGAEVWLDGAAIMVADDGRFVIGFGREAASVSRLRVQLPDGEEFGREIAIGARSYNIERVDGLPPRTVTIPPEEKARRAAERAKVARARGDVSRRMDWSGRFAWPARGRVSGVYGSQRILNGEPRWPHFGLDVAGPVGTPVGAPLSGRVVLAETDFLLEGGIIIIDHGFGVTSTLMHLSQVDVRVGDRVGRGDRVGAIGATGRASGPHVDWRVNWHKVRLDPALLVGPMEGGE